MDTGSPGGKGRDLEEGKREWVEPDWNRGGDSIQEEREL